MARYLRHYRLEESQDQNYVRVFRFLSERGYSVKKYKDETVFSKPIDRWNETVVRITYPQNRIQLEAWLLTPSVLGAEAELGPEGLFGIALKGELKQVIQALDSLLSTVPEKPVRRTPSPAKEATPVSPLSSQVNSQKVETLHTPTLLVMQQLAEELEELLGKDKDTEKKPDRPAPRAREPMPEPRKPESTPRPEPKWEPRSTPVSKPKAEPKPTPSYKPKTGSRPAARRKTAAAPKSSPSGSAGVIDINTCTQSQLMELPGISLVQAKRAMEYREERGGFRSADEFVQVLNIKPHFAVQIFPRITVSAAPQPPKPDRDQDTTVRRVFDI